MVDEPEQTPYYLAMRFSDERQAERVYFQVQRYIKAHEADLNLSVYRFLYDEKSIVAVLGDDPGDEVQQHLTRRLTGGARTELDEQVLRFLIARREQAGERGSWVERHYRPGQGFRLDR